MPVVLVVLSGFAILFLPSPVRLLVSCPLALLLLLLLLVLPPVLLIPPAPVVDMKNNKMPRLYSRRRALCPADAAPGLFQLRAGLLVDG